MPITKEKLLVELLARFGGKFSRELGIDLEKGRSEEIFKWFLAAKLFGARISTEIAERTYGEFQRRGVMTPEGIVHAGWNGLVSILDAGGYARYDFSTATRLLAIMERLIRSYGGDLNELHSRARDSEELERLLKGLGSGIGEVTVNIFLRELRTVWPKARPRLSELAHAAAVDLKLISGREEDELVTLEQLWSKHPVPGRDFCDLEAALVRLGKGYCRKERHATCPFRAICATT